MSDSVLSWFLPQSTKSLSSPSVVHECYLNKYAQEWY